ncbi:MAG: hypothetical protein R6U44_01090 [Archaeoglobaceae archaeon]
MHPYIVECRACGKRIVPDNRNGITEKLKEHAEEHYEMKNLPGMLIDEMKKTQKI